MDNLTKIWHKCERCGEEFNNKEQIECIKDTGLCLDCYNFLENTKKPKF